MIEMPFPAANTSVYFTFDTLRRTTLITPEAKDALGVWEGPGVGGQPDFGACVELPAARIGDEHGDHYLLVMDAVVANSEQVRYCNRHVKRKGTQPRVAEFCPAKHHLYEFGWLFWFSAELRSQLKS